MSFKALLGDITPKYVGLSKTEAKILRTMITVKRGNAYGLWKASGLKHYPTVLRSVKKLKEKRLVQILSENGARGERVFAPTLVGTLVSYIFNGEEKKIVEIVAENSSLFRELYKIDKDDYWAFAVVQDIIVDVYRKEEPRSFDEAVKDKVEGAIVDNVTDGVFNRDTRSMDWILKLPKVKWVREIAIEWIESERQRTKQMMNDLDELKKRLTNQMA